MGQNEQRKKFIEQFAVNVSQIERKKHLEKFAGHVIKIKDKKTFEEESEKMKPTIIEVADGYRSYIADLGEGFLEIVETYNECLYIAKQNGLIENMKVKARIKDFSSSWSNTDAKLLDDVFGMEIVTGKKVEESELEPSELEKAKLEKEILILFNHLAFDIDKDKIYNKRTGYNAYHCMGDFSPKNGDLKNIIRQIVNETKTREYKYSKHEPSYNSKKDMISIFPLLIEYIKNDEDLNNLTKVMKEMIEYMKTISVPKEEMPIIEFHFLTSEAEKKAIIGSASHSSYKNINPTLIEDYFLSGRLIRGINAPWKFESEGQKMKLQDFYTTLLENWPFLTNEIDQKRNLGKEEREKSRISRFDKLTATQFPFLRKYLGGNNRYDEKTSENWGLLRAMLIANRIDFNDKSLKPIEDEIMEFLGR